MFKLSIEILKSIIKLCSIKLYGTYVCGVKKERQSFKKEVVQHVSRPFLKFLITFCQIMIGGFDRIRIMIDRLVNLHHARFAKSKAKRAKITSPNSHLLVAIFGFDRFDSSPNLNPSQQKAKKQHQLKRIRRFVVTIFTSFTLTLQLSGLSLWFNLQPAYAATNLAIEPITWDFVGLDSNNPESQGPNTYVVGARVCNLGSEDAVNVKAKFFKDGVDNGYTYIRLQGSDTYTFPLIPKNTGANSTGTLNYIFDTPANSSAQKTKYDISYTPTNCQDFYYNFETSRTSAALQTYQRYYIESWADNAGFVQTPRPRQIYIERLISQGRNYIYNFGCTTAANGSNASGLVNVTVGEVFTCTASAHTSGAYPAVSFTADIPNVIFQVLDVHTTYSSGGVNSTVYGDGCGWIQDPTDPRYHKSPSQCDGTDQYSGGGVGGDINTTYKMKVISFPNGGFNPIKVSNTILDNSGGSFHYNSDYGSGGNTISINVNNPPATDLKIAKTHTGNFSYGTNAYNLTVSATSAAAKAPVTIKDTLPTGYSFTSLTGTDAAKWTCGASGQVVSCTYDPNGDSVADDFPIGSNALTLNVNAANTITNGSNSTNFVQAASNSAQVDSNLANNTASDPTTLLLNADLSIAKTLVDGDLSTIGNQTSLTIGKQATYRLAVTNGGNITATTPTITDTLPDELTFISSTPTCTVSEQDITCNLSNLAAAATTNVDVTVQVRDTTGTSIINQGKVASTTYDSNLTNNKSSITTSILRPIPDLIITKTPNPIALILNKSSNYTIQVSNIGASATSGVTKVSETFPTGMGMKYIAHSGTGWSCIYTDTSTSTNRPCTSGDTTGGTKSIDFYNAGTIAASANSSFVLTVQATADPGTTQNNTVVVSTLGEVTTTNNTATSATSIGKPDLSITKTHSEPMLAGASNDYTITVTNKSGSATTTGPITVTETLPNTSFTYVSHTGSGWGCIYQDASTSARACQSGDGTNATKSMKFYNTGPLAAGASSSFTLTVNPGSTAITTAVNNTVVVATEGEASTTLTDNTYNDSTTSTTAAASSRDIAVEKRLTRVSSSSIGLTATSPTAIVYAASPTSSQCSLALPAGASNADDFSGSGTTAAIDTGSTTRKYTCPALTAGQYVQYKIAVGSNQSSGNGRDIDISFNDTVPSIIQNVSWACTVPEPMIGGGGNSSGDSSCGTTTSGSGNAINIPSISLKKRGTGSSSGIIPYALITVIGQVKSGATATELARIENIGNLGADATLSNNIWTVQSGSGSGTVTTPADLNITKTGVASLNNYAQGTYTITVANANANATTNRITVTDTLPTGLDFVSASGTGWTCTSSGSIATCFSDTAIAGNTTSPNPISLTVQANATATLPTTVTNRVSVSTPGETVLTNNNATATTTINAPALPNLTIAKTHSGTAFTNGVNGTYTITVNNASTTVAATTPITVTDTLPTGLTYVSAAGTNWTCSNSGQIVLCNTTQTISPSSSATPITLTVKPTLGTGTVTNNVRVDTTANGEISTTDNTASDSTPLQSPNVDLLITKQSRSLDGANVVTQFSQGQRYIYRLAVSHNTTSTAPAVGPITVVDALPTGITYLSSNSGDDFTCAASGQTVTCTRTSSLALGSTATVDLVVQVGSSTTGTITNNARVNSASDLCADFTCTGTNALNNRTTLTNTVIGISDLGIAKTTAGTFVAGQPGVFQFKVTNNGAADYPGAIQFNDSLNSNFTFASIDPNDAVTGTAHGFTCSGSSPLICTKPTTGLPGGVSAGLLAGQSATVNVSVNVSSSASGSISNTASLDATTLTAAADPTNTNDTSTVSVAIQPNTSTLLLAKDDGDGESPDEPTTASYQTKWAVGGTGNYTLITTNNGPASAKQPVIITDNLAAITGTPLTYQSFQPTANWNCSASTSTNVSCTYGTWSNGLSGTFTPRDLPAGASSGVQILVNVAANATPATITNMAKVVSANNSTGATNTEQTVLIQPADLQVTKTGADTLTAGGTGTYTITVTNNGPGISNPDLYLEDYLPVGLTYNGATSGSAAGDGTWTIQSYNSGANQITYKRTTALANAATTTIQVPVQIAANPPASVTNLVRVQGFTPEPIDPTGAACDASFTTQPTNNCATKTSTIMGAGVVSTDLSIIKTASNSSPAYNTNYNYTLTVTNNSTAAQDVSITDTLPNNLQIVSVGTPSPLSSTTPFGTVNRTCSQGTITQGTQTTLTNTVSCNLFTVPANQTVTVSLTAKGLGSGTIPNTATITTTTSDTNASNNSSTALVTIPTTTGLNTISGRVFNDVNNNGTLDAETGTANSKVRLYQDSGTVSGAYDANDILISTTTTDSSGDYSFTLGIKGNFVLNVDPTTLPTGATQTPTGNPTIIQVAGFITTTGGSDINNNFGYKLPTVLSVPKLNLVKRITAINGVSIPGFVDDTLSSKAADDNDPKWPSANSTYLRGALACTTTSTCNSVAGVKPGDNVEYSIYFLANGTDNLKNVKICDRVPSNTTFERDTYGVGKGILFGWNSSSLTDPSSSTGTDKSPLTNTVDSDKGTFFDKGDTTAYGMCGDNSSSSTTNGAVGVQVVSGTDVVPQATAAGTPPNSYGFVRFNVKVK